MSKRLTFLTEFFRDRKQTGSVTPSSPSLIRKMTRVVDYAKANLIVELGPGTGPMTKELLKRMRKETRLLIFETNEVFCNELKKLNDPRMIIVNDSAEKIGEYLKKWNLPKPDYVICSIPLTVIPVKIRMRILAEIRDCLKPGGVYTQFHYSRINEKILRRFFPALKLEFTAFNIPPAFVYICVNAPVKK